MTARQAIGAGALAFTSIVTASFGYGLLLLVRSPVRPREGAEARPAPLPPDVMAVLERSAEHLKKGEVEQAIFGYRRVLTQGPSKEALLGLADAEWRAGRQDDAVREYERVLRLDPREMTALSRVARAHAGHRETWELAEARYREYLSLVPADAEAWLGLGRVLAWRGKAAEAAEIYARDDVQPLLTAGDRRSHAFALVRAGRTREAEPMLDRLARADPADVDVTLSLGGLHASRADWERALPLYKAALERRPDDPRTNLTYGQGLLAIGDYAAALGPLEKASRGLPANASAGVAHARALRGAGDPKRAAAEYERVMPLLDGDSEVEREYADLMLERRSYAKAAALYRRAMDHGLRDERLLAGLAGALSADGRPKEALPYLEEAYSVRRNERIGLDLARLFKRLGQNERALELLAEIEAKQPTP